MSFTQYILFILHKTGRSLQAALNTFFASMGEEVGDYSKQAFSKGRLRIKPEAIGELFSLTAREFYSQAQYETLLGYRVLAIDGTKLNLPNTPELAKEFGVQMSKGEPQVQALVSGLYDVLNKIMVDVCISSCKSDERKHADELIQRLHKDTQTKNLIIMDRGYPSAELLHQLESNSQAYVIRCSSTFVKGMRCTGNDCIVEHRFAKLDKPLKLRVVRAVLPKGTEEILITNLSANEISLQQLCQIYKLRWGIETNYDCIKNKLCVENFSGVGKIAVLQDFYATVFLWNLTGIMAFDLHDEIESAHRSKHNKHEYRLNISMTISALKERVVELVMCENQRKSGRILRQICKALQKSVVAVNNDRTFPRHCKHRSLKFHNNAKAL